MLDMTSQHPTEVAVTGEDCRFGLRRRSLQEMGEARLARVVSARLTDVRRDRDFGRVEATVALLYDMPGCRTPRLARVRTSVDAGPAGRSQLRRRLLEDALGLMRLACSRAA